MNTEEYEALGINIKVEIFDFDMMETIWPMSGYDDPGIWLRIPVISDTQS